MATLKDLDRAYIEAQAREDGLAAREDRKFHARERITYTLRDRTRADILAERKAEDGRR